MLTVFNVCTVMLDGFWCYWHLWQNIQVVTRDHFQFLQNRFIYYAPVGFNLDLVRTMDLRWIDFLQTVQRQDRTWTHFGCFWGSLRKLEYSFSILSGCFVFSMLPVGLKKKNIFNSGAVNDVVYKVKASNESPSVGGKWCMHFTVFSSQNCILMH